MKSPKGEFSVSVLFSPIISLVISALVLNDPGFSGSVELNCRQRLMNEDAVIVSFSVSIQLFSFNEIM